MAKLPSVLDKRPIIYGKQTAEDKVKAVGLQFLANGDLNDAIDCFRKIKDTEELKKLTPQMVEMGDFFFAKKIDEFSPLTKEEWKNLAENAEKQNKIFFARSAYAMLEDEQKQEQLFEKIKEDFPGSYLERL
ncbi:hypothetical protein [Candidatus Uabimicrobium sp. HlEnr_7]|uniref:hypothetical protein n=1 Tax=Candidatus Uabimicrobium helgolandensis TaxID=3095367 RepID=UPI003556EAFF